MSFLSQWRDAIRHTLREDDRKVLGRRYHKLALHIPDSFPDVGILDLYMYPVTSNYEDINLNMPRPPDVATLGALCERYFAWGSPDGIVARFNTCVLPGIVVRLLINEATNRDQSEDAKPEYAVSVNTVFHRASG